MEGPCHSKKARIGEHIYGHMLLIDGVPYHFEKYIPTDSVEGTLLQNPSFYAIFRA